MRRRSFLRGASASGAVLLARPGGTLLGSLSGGTAAQVAGRASRLFPGSFLVHADMHNHSLFSDGDGDPAEAFISMRDHGLDVAALTDHSVLGGPLGVPFEVCGSKDCKSIQGIDEENWAATAGYADAADAPGSFVAIRGFEWSSPSLGHMNVWFSTEWVDPERTAGLVGVEGLELLTDEIPTIGPVVGEPLADLVGSSPIAGTAMMPFYEWLRTPPGGGLLGGGLDGIAGFNHPGREPGRFGQFRYEPRLADQVVSIELFNRDEDYLFEGTDTGEASPLTQCLDAGWRPGILGVTDEHSPEWGGPLGKGRAGIWVTELSRAGVRSAMEQRAFFATRERGLRVDATANSIRMGSDVPHDSGPVTFQIDIDKGSEWVGKPLLVQLLRSGAPLPQIVDTVPIEVPAADEPVVTFTRDLARADGGWIVLRITDPDGEPDGRATGEYVGAGRAVAYTSPFYLVPAGSQPAAGAGATGQASHGGVASASSPVEVPVEVYDARTLPVTGSSTPLLGTGAALGAAAIAALAARRASVSGDHDHPPG